ncbi:MAG TPA: serine hydrolase domain-containing protein [Bacillota bacterium]
MRISGGFNWLLVIGVIFSSLFCRNMVHAETSDQSVQAFARMTDGYMKQVLNEYKVAGVAVVIVKDGAVFFEKGYGYADLAQKIPVNPRTTAFQIASVSKLFTATAAMQLVEQGKLSLDEDINHYLTDFKIKNPFPKPVTLRTLLTHTSGLDDRTPVYIRTPGTRFFDSIEPLESYIKRDLPPVVKEPGSYCQYNVYGMALVGYLVQKVSGVPFDQYVTDHILKPLAMKHSSYELTPAILKSMAKPYRFVKGEYLEGAYTLISDHPSGSICATASDMAKFILMNLNHGEYPGGRILNGDTLREMHRHQYPADERLTGFGLGFYETIRNGYRTIEHGGYLPSFSSKLTMLPERNIGMFIAINTDSKDSSRVCNDFVDKFYGFFTTRVRSEKALAALQAGVPLDMDPQVINGNYTYDAYGRTDLTKLKSLLVTCNIQCDPSGNLTFTAENLKWKFGYVGDGYFYNMQRDMYCRITEANGKMVLSVLGGDYEKVSDLEAALFKAAVAGIPVFLIAIVMLLISLIKNRKCRDKQAMLLKGSLLGTGLLIVTYFVLNGVMGVKSMQCDTYAVIHGIIPFIKVTCYLTLGFGAASIVSVTNSWINKSISLLSRIFYSIIVIWAVVNLVFMYLMNGFRL